jgi:hypothetical protein
VAELDKWQVREAKQYAQDNEVSYDAAVKVLFPADVPEAPAEVPEPGGKSGGSAAKAALSK